MHPAATRPAGRPPQAQQTQLAWVQSNQHHEQDLRPHLHQHVAEGDAAQQRALPPIVKHAQAVRAPLRAAASSINGEVHVDASCTAEGTSVPGALQSLIGRHRRCCCARSVRMAPPSVEGRPCMAAEDTK
jgi:hypothetical protein